MSVNTANFKKVPRRQTETVLRDGYKVLKNVYFPTRDSSVLCANVYLPLDEGGSFPTLLTLGPYGKDVHFTDLGQPKTDLYTEMAKAITPLGPDACFEVPDPLIWCKEYGYAMVRVDVRGTGGSPGVLDAFGLKRSVELNADSEGQDVYDAIEWAAAQAWSSGKVAVCGISYYGMICWWAAIQQPPHLAAIVPYEGSTEYYSEALRCGGIFHSGFQKHWFSNLIKPVQYGVNELDEETLAAQRFEYPSLETTWAWEGEGPWPILARTRRLEKVQVPVLSAGNWTDCEVHLPGNLTGFEGVSSKSKFLEMHAGNHIGSYYDPSHLERQRRFLDYFLLDKKDNGLDKTPQIELTIRNGTQNSYRVEPTWPPKDTVHTPLYITPGNKLSFTPYTPSEEDGAITYPGLTGSVTLQTDPMEEPMEILGFPSFEISVATDAKDMDIFVCFYLLDPEGKTVVMVGNHGEPSPSFCRTWFRISHRNLSSASTTDRPRLDQHSPAPVEPNVFYKVSIPVKPTSMIIGKGHRLAIALRANDEPSTPSYLCHTGPDRSEETFSGTNKIAYGGKVVLPIVHR